MSETAIFILFVALFFVAVPAALVIQGLRFYRHTQKQEEDFKTRVEALGLNRLREDPVGLSHRYAFVGTIREGQGAGSSAKTANVIHGQYKGHWVLVFDYDRFSTLGSGTSSRECCFFVLEMGAPLPALRIHPKTLATTLAHLGGFRDIDFQGSQTAAEFTKALTFSKAFTVRAKDEPFARNVCHGEMMDYLLQHRALKIEIEGTTLTLEFDKHLDPADLEGRLQHLIAIASLVPADPR